VSEHYNHVFVVGTRLDPEQATAVVVSGLKPFWGTVGAPARLTKINVGAGVEEQHPFSEHVLRKVCDEDSNTVIVIRPAIDGIGSALCYTLGRYAGITVSRPFALLAPKHRRESLLACWQSIDRQVRCVFAVSGRELELSEAEVEAGVLDARRLFDLQGVEFLLLRSGSPIEGADCVELEAGTLVTLQSDPTGGYALS